METATDRNCTKIPGFQMHLLQNDPPAQKMSSIWKTNAVDV